MEEITIKIELDVKPDSGGGPCKNCVRGLKDLISNGELPNIRIPKGMSLLIAPDYNSAGVLGYYHIDILDRKFFRKFPHPMEWVCPECYKLYKTKGQFKRHLAKEYKVPIKTIELLDNALMQKG